MEFEHFDCAGYEGLWHHRSVISALRAYWEAMRKNDSPPLRTDISPRGMSDILENVFLIERISFGNARLRIAGTSLNELAGMDMRGMPFSVLFSAAARTQLQNGLERLFTMPTILHLDLEAEHKHDKTHEIVAKMQIMPLIDPAQGTHLAIAAIECRDPPNMIARRFSIANMQMERLHHKEYSGPQETQEVANVVPLHRAATPMLGGMKAG